MSLAKGHFYTLSLNDPWQIYFSSAEYFFPLKRQVWRWREPLSQNELMGVIVVTLVHHSAGHGSAYEESTKSVRDECLSLCWWHYFEREPQKASLPLWRKLPECPPSAPTPHFTCSGVYHGAYVRDSRWLETQWRWTRAYFMLVIVGAGIYDFISMAQETRYKADPGSVRARPDSSNNVQFQRFRNLCRNYVKPVEPGSKESGRRSPHLQSGVKGVALSCLQGVVEEG